MNPWRPFYGCLLLFPFLSLMLTAQSTAMQGDGCAGVTHTVVTTEDSGPGSLRAAVEAANADTTDRAQCIRFAIPSADAGYDSTAGVWYIRLQSAPLPALTHDKTTLDGTTQTEIMGDTNPAGPEIVLDGAAIQSPAYGLVLNGDDIVVRGLVIVRFTSSGILLQGNGNIVIGNYIGVGPDGHTAQGMGEHGVQVQMAQNTRIGSDEPGDRNIISGNAGWGVFIRQSPATFVRGNTIGLGADGWAGVGNTAGGVHVDGSSGVAIGGFSDARGNVISGNGGPGIEMDGVGGQGNNDIAHNRIGTDASGIAPRPNLGDGIRLFGGLRFVTVTANVISGNRLDGVHVLGSSSIMIQDNHIGAGADGVTVIGNGSHGVELELDADSNVIGPGNVILGNNFGVQIVGSDNNRVVANFIGVDQTGLMAPGNAAHGVAIQGGAQSNLIGGTTFDNRNLISGNGGHGVMIMFQDTRYNRVMGNYIGTDITGIHDLGNGGSGVSVGESADNNVIGLNNVIAGNDRYGIEVSRAPLITIQGNHIGIGADGRTPLANELGGVRLFLVTNGWIGGETPSTGNVIAGNGGDGVSIIAGGNIRVYRNALGTTFEGVVGVGNTGNGLVINGGAQEVFIGRAPNDGNIVAGNWGNGLVVQGLGTARHVLAGNYVGSTPDGLTLGNAGHGILFVKGASDNEIDGGVVAYNGDDGVRVEGELSVGNRLVPGSITGNAGLGIRLVDGGNHGLTRPIILGVAGDQVIGSACAGCLIHLYADSDGQGAQRLDMGEIHADTSGRFTATIPANAGPFITATATDEATNDTSEFSPPVPHLTAHTRYFPLTVHDYGP